jgi:DNA-binding NtrC family response regulator
MTALIVIWSRQEPDRLGEALLLPSNDPGPWIFGRGSGGEQRRISLVRQRPGAIEQVGPLACPRISRMQLRLSVGAGGGVSVENLGACPLVHGGREVARAEVAPGEVLELSNELLFLCVRREPIPPASSSNLELPLHTFGEADASGMVGESAAMGELRQRIAAAAPHPAHVLILGESGSGKELVARAIHARSSRGKRPLVARNAATIPEGLADAELFGNVRNYPNPGMPERPGLIGEAHQSTLFLDEFAELPPRLQAHLLRVMDEGEYQRLGESTPRRADLRIVTATNRPTSAIKHDVLARLQIHLVVPDLNARREDIPLLARSLLRRRAAADRRIAERFFPEGDPESTPRISPGLMAALVQHRYTTHVRELDALLLGAALGSRGKYVELGAAMRRDLESRAQPQPTTADALASFSPEERVRLLLLRQHLFRPTACGRDPAYPGNRQTADLHLRQLLCKALAVAEWDTARATALLAGGAGGELHAKAQSRLTTFLSNLRAHLSSPAAEAALRRSLADEWKGTVSAALQVVEALRAGKIQGEAASPGDAGGGAPPLDRS